MHLIGKYGSYLSMHTSTHWMQVYTYSEIIGAFLFLLINIFYSLEVVRVCGDKMSVLVCGSMPLAVKLNPSHQKRMSHRQI